MATILSEGTIQELRESIRAEVGPPADAGYALARAIWKREDRQAPGTYRPRRFVQDNACESEA